MVTLPNLILAWHAATDPTPQEEWNISDDLELTEETLQAFTQTLQDTHIDLRFFWGDWAGASISPDTAAHFNPHSIDLMLTSETIYESANLPALIRLLRLLPRWPNCTCLVAAKNVYFGLSGGVHLFKSLVMDDGASTVEEVANILPAVTGGVERVILNVTSV